MGINDQQTLLSEAMSSYAPKHQDGALWQQLSSERQQVFLQEGWMDVAAELGEEPDLTRWQSISAILEQALWLARQERQPERPRIVAETVDGLGSRRYESAAAATPAGRLSPRTLKLCQQLVRERRIHLSRG